MDDRVINNIKEIANNGLLKGILRESLVEIKPTKKNIVQYLFATIISAVTSYFIIYKSNTVESMRFAVDIINNTALAFVAIIFGTYAIFQALMTDSVVKALLKSEVNLLNISNKSFLNLVLLYVWEIILNVVILIALNIMPVEFCLFSNIHLSSIVATLLCFVYFAYSFLIFYEIKNFTVNLYRMFSVYNVYHSLDVIKEQEDEEED